MKIIEINKPAPSNDPAAIQKQKELNYRLWTYCESKMLSICQSFDSQPADVTSMLEILKLIVNRYTLEDLSKRLLVEVFL